MKTHSHTSVYGLCAGRVGPRRDRPQSVHVPGTARIRADHIFTALNYFFIGWNKVIKYMVTEFIN